MPSSWLYKPEAIEMSSKHLTLSFHTSYECSYGLLHEIIRQANRNSLSCKDKILSENHNPPPFETKAQFFAQILWILN